MVESAAFEKPTHLVFHALSSRRWGISPVLVGPSTREKWVPRDPTFVTGIDRAMEVTSARGSHAGDRDADPETQRRAQVDR